MTRKELVLCALSHQESSPIPYHMDLTQQALENLTNHTQDPQALQGTEGCLHYIQYWGWPTEIPDQPGHFRDEFGVVWNRTGADKEIGVISQPLIEDLEDTDYSFPVCDEARLRKEYQDLVSTKGDRFCMAGFGFCMFERLWSLTGMENALASMVLCPEALDQFMERNCRYFEHLLDIALEYDIDGVYFGDDWGQQRGLIMGPEHWRRFIKPYMARLYSKVKAKGKYVFQHSCGDCHEIFPDLIEIGLDCYQTFQPEIYDIAKMKALYGDKLTFWGGISTQRCLPFADEAGLRAEVSRIAATLRPNGGFILAPTHAIAFDVPPKNILTLCHLFRHQEEIL